MGDLREWMVKQAEYIKLSTMDADWHADQILSFLKSQNFMRVTFIATGTPLDPSTPCNICRVEELE